MFVRSVMMTSIPGIGNIVNRGNCEANKDENCLLRLENIMKKVLLIFICVVLSVVFVSCSNSDSKKNLDSNPPFNASELQFEGDYLIESVELSDNDNFIENITLAKNNFDNISAFKEGALKSIDIFEAEVIWNMNNSTFELDKGYDIGENKIAFNNTNLMYSSSMDTGEVSWHIDNENWEFEVFKVYNFCCSIDDEKFNSYFVYTENEQNRSLIPITESQLEYSLVNCVLKDSSLYLANFTGVMLGNDADEPEFELYGDAIANYVVVEDRSY